MKRPLVIVASLYAAGLLLGEFLPLPLHLLFPAAAATLAAAALWPAGRRPCLIAALLLAGWTHLTLRTAIISPHDLRTLQGAEPALLTLRGRLLETPSVRKLEQPDRTYERSLAQLDVRQILPQGSTNWIPGHGKTLTVTRGLLPKECFAGQEVEVSGVLALPPGAAAAGLFDYRAYLRRHSIYYQLKAESAEDWQVLGPERSPPLGDRFLNWAQATLGRGLPEEDLSLRLLWAMTLGWKNVLPQEVYDPFIRTGTMHIFAISGLHIALIAAILVQVLRVVRVPQFFCGLLVVPLIWFYTGATGWQPSAIRATIMTTVVVVGWALSRPTDLVNSLAGAGFIILLWDPQQLFGASFQLSFLVVLSIALLVPRLQTWRDRWLAFDPLLPPELAGRWHRRGVAMARTLFTFTATSFAAWLGALPLTAYYFHIVSPVTLAANVLVVPASSAALACNLGSLISNAWLPWVTEILNFGAWWWMQCMVRLCDWAVAAPASHFYVKGPDWFDFALYYGFLALAFSGRLAVPLWRRATLAALPVIGFVYLAQWTLTRHAVVLDVLPLEGGNAIYNHGPGPGQNVLIDCGKSNAVQFITKPFLRAHGIDRLDALVLSHGDARHVGGAQALAAELNPKLIWMNATRFRSPVYRQLLEVFECQGRGLGHLKRGDVQQGWRVLHPEATDRFNTADDQALVLYGSFAGVRVLLLSDLGRKGQDALLLREHDLHAQVLISGLPTSGEPLCEALLDKIQPELLIITDAEYPASERAPPRLQQRLTRRGLRTVFTSQTGPVRLRLTPGHWHLEPHQDKP